jgi:hypothetical protein
LGRLDHIPLAPPWYADNLGDPTRTPGVFRKMNDEIHARRNRRHDESVGNIFTRQQWQGA